MKSDFFAPFLIEKMSFVSFRYIFLSLFLLGSLSSIEIHAADPKPAFDLKKAAPQAQQLFLKKNYKELRNLLLPHLDQLDQQRLSLLAQAHFELSEYHEAVRVAQLMISRNEKDETAYTLAGRAEFRLKKEPTALEHFKKALELNSKYEPAYRSLVELYDQRKNYYELALLYNEMITQMGEKTEYLNKICQIYTLDSLYDQAMKACKKAISKDPRFPDNHVYIGVVYRNQKDEALAATQLKKAAEQFPKSVLAQSTYAQFLENKKDYIGSYKHYTNCLQLDAKDETCLLGHGHSAAQLMKYEESLESLKKACNINRKNAVPVRKILQMLRTEKKMEWIPKYEALVEKCLSI